MGKLKIYMDTCCHSRPFDDLTKLEIKNEADAKRYIQSLIKFDGVDLCSSFMLFYEINDIPFLNIREHVLDFVDKYSAFFVGIEKESEAVSLSEKIMKTGVKSKDAIHLACSIIAKCDYFITTDKRVLKYKTDKIKVVNPIEFVKLWEENI